MKPDTHYHFSILHLLAVFLPQPVVGFGVAFVTTMTITMTSCGSKDNVSVSRAVSDGTYKISRPVCASTGYSPPYPSPDLAVALLDFDEVIARTWTVSGADLTLEMSDSDCKVSLKRRISANSSSTFAITKEKTAVFTPDQCEFSASGGGTTAKASKNLAQVFQDSSDPAAEWEYAVDRVGDDTRLTTYGVEPLRSGWSTYGCSTPDAIGYSLTKSN